MAAGYFIGGFGSEMLKEVGKGGIL